VTEAGLTSLENALTRSNDALMKRKKKQRLIKVGGKVACHARRWHVDVASGFPQSRGHRKLFRRSVV